MHVWIWSCEIVVQMFISGTMISQIKPPLSFIEVEVGVRDGNCSVVRSLGHEYLVEHYEKIGISEGGEDEDGIWSLSPMSLS